MVLNHICFGKNNTPAGAITDHRKACGKFALSQFGKQRNFQVTLWLQLLQFIASKAEPTLPTSLLDLNVDLTSSLDRYTADLRYFQLLFSQFCKSQLQSIRLMLLPFTEISMALELDPKNSLRRILLT